MKTCIHSTDLSEGRYGHYKRVRDRSKDACNACLVLAYDPANWRGGKVTFQVHPHMLRHSTGYKLQRPT
jgi:hypothetical protein